ncbi:tetratricopeptide repeat protein [Spiribacter insolitus]|uniref:Tetratricopeptide repeat protein n=1 Tax=Spiribacter insolitus TaxID=3122417 RepID=A0ABV3T3Y2_9GAMM
MAWLLTACVPMAGNDVPVAERADTRVAVSADAVATGVESPMHRVMAAELAAVRGHFERASALYAEAAEQIRDPEVMARAVQVALRADRPERAIALARRWVGLAPDSIEAKQLLGVMQLRAGQSDVAMQTLLDSVPPPGPNRNPAIARLGALLLDGALPPEALDIMQAIARAAPRSEAAKLALARLALARGEPAIALRAVDEALADRPDWVSALLLRSDALLALDRPNAAVAIFENLLVDSPDNRALRRDYARILLDLGRDAEALMQYRDLVTAGATHPQLLSTAAILAMQAGDDELALEALRRLRQANPGFRARSLLLEGGLLRRADRFEESLAVFNRGLRDYPGNTELRYGRAMTRIMDGDLNGGETDLRRILQDDPGDARTLNALGYTLVDQTDRIAEGAVLIERAYAIKPDDPAIIDSMGWAAYRQGDPERALGYLRRAHELTDGDAEIAAHLGEVLWVLGQREAARDIWAQAAANDADHPVLRETRERLNP